MVICGYVSQSRVFDGKLIDNPRFLLDRVGHLLESVVALKYFLRKSIWIDYLGNEKLSRWWPQHFNVSNDDTAVSLTTFRLIVLSFILSCEDTVLCEIFLAQLRICPGKNAMRIKHSRVL